MGTGAEPANLAAMPRPDRIDPAKGLLVVEWPLFGELSRALALKGAEIVLTVRRPAASLLSGVAKGALVIGSMDPYGHEDDILALGKAGVTAIAM